VLVFALSNFLWSGQVVVITGASGGLGRATAMAFAAQGAEVVLCARRDEPLQETARLCRELGATASALVADVTIETEVAAFVEFAQAQSGRIDVWVNNAGVTLFAPLEGATFAEHQRVIETNLFGSMRCARAILPILRQQGAGVIINVSSILGKIGQPFVPSYSISKFALRGLTDALRAELADQPNIHACSILPFAIDTPHFESGANYFGKQAHALPPVQSPAKVAEAIVLLARRPRRELHVPRIALAGLAVHALMPRAVERLMLFVLSKWHFSARLEPAREGNLFMPTEATAEPRGTRGPQLSAPALGIWLAMQLAERLTRSRKPRARRTKAKLAAVSPDSVLASPT